MVESALKSRRQAPDVHGRYRGAPRYRTGSRELRDVYLYTVDDLEEVIQENLKSRQEAAEQARDIIEFQVDEFRRGCVRWTPSI